MDKMLKRIREAEGISANELRRGLALCWLVLFALPLSAQQWPTHRGDNARSGIATEAFDCSRLELAWKWQASTPPETAWDGPARWDAFAAIRDLPAMRQYDACFHPVSDGERVYFGSSSEDQLFALDLKTGKLAWNFVANGPIRLAPTVDNGNVYFGCDDGFAYCVNSANGKLTWKFSPSKHMSADPRRVINNDRLISFYPVRTGVTIRDGLAYFGASFLPWRESYLCCVDSMTGKPDGEGAFVVKSQNATIEGNFLVTQDRILVPQGRVAPLMFERKSGKKIGSLPGGGGVTIVLTEQGEVVRTEGGKASRPGSIGVFKGKERVASFPRGRAIVVDKDRYFVIDGEKLFAATRTNNELKWQLNVNEPLEIIKLGRFLAIGGRDHVTVVEQNQGKVVWSTQVEGRVFGLAVAGKKLIASTDTGAVYAFAATAANSWSAPKGNQSLTKETSFKSPVVATVRKKDLLHRWVFHRSAMKGPNNSPVAKTQFSNVQVGDQAGNVSVRLKGSGEAISVGDSKKVEAIHLKNSYFPLEKQAASSLPSNNITAEAWVRVDEQATWGGIVGHIQDDGSTEHGWLLGYRGDKFSFAVAGDKGGLTYLTSSKSFQMKSWNHVVGTYNGSEMRLYVNGALVANSQAEKGAISYSDKCYFSIGTYRDANESYPMKGALHEVRIYNNVLTAPMITRMYRARASEFPKTAAASEPSRNRNISWGPIARYNGPGKIQIRYGTKTASRTFVNLIQDQSTTPFVSEAPTTEHTVQLHDLPHRRELQFQIVTGEGDKAEKESFALDTHFNWVENRREVGAEWVRELIEQGPNPRGLAVVVGHELADKALALASQSQYGVCLVVENQEQADEIRKRWQSLLKPGNIRYGKKLSVVPQALDELPGAFASVVIGSSENKQLRRLVRPQGGILANSEAKVEWKRGSLKGSGEWSHMYGRADNSAFGGESLSNASNRSDLLTQWIGRPGPRYQTDRQNRKPSPLAAGGRLFLQGQQRMIALDSYNGSVLWSVESPTVMRWNVPHDSSNWCADEKGVYVAAHHQVWFLNGRTGNLDKQFKIPAHESITEEFDWGYLARKKDALIGTAVKSEAIYSNWWGKYHWFDSTGGADTHVVAGDLLFSVNAESGKPNWTYKGLVLHPTITLYSDAIYFVEDKTQASIKSEKRRVSLEKELQLELVCLDFQTGKPRWRRPLRPFEGHVSVLYLAAGGDSKNECLVMVASEATKSHFAVSTFDLKAGTPRWDRKVKWETNHHGKHISRPAIESDLVYLRPEVMKLSNGETLTRGFPSGHGCSSYALSTNGLFSRLGETTWWDVRNNKVNRFKRIRTDCWISVIPAQGMVLSAEGGGGCSCGSWLEISLGFLPRSVDEHHPDQ